MKIFNLILFLTILYSGCTNKTGSVDLTYKTSIKFEILPNESFLFHQYLLDNMDEYLICLDSSVAAFSFYSLTNNKKVFSIPIGNVCSNYSNRWNDAYIVSVDSVIIFNSESNQLFLLDEQGTIIDEWEFEKYIKDQEFHLFSGTSNNIYFKNKTIYCGIVRTDIRLNTKSTLLEYYNSPTNLIMKVSSNANQSFRLFGTFPDSYSNNPKNFYDVTPSRTISEENTILSFNKDHNLYIYNQDGDLIKTINAKSNYINNFVEIDEKNTYNFNYLKKYLTVEPKYERVIYDPFTHLYYRIVKHRIDNYENEDGTIKSMLDSDYSIIFLDKNFNIIDEFLFDSKQYYIPGLIPTKNGVLLPSINKNEKHFFSSDIFKVTVK